ncbi:hypothetical protein DYQ86_22845 [Acidobacteria bacterium AB60]|nr:hypothetical protein DYQ86_22845 [Acidobacteria bacterium AB60]
MKIGYLYDAGGARLAKGTITAWTCDPTTNGFQVTENYVLGFSGEELSMLDGSNNVNWQRTNIYAGGKLIGTYDPGGLHFHIEDPLGTRRVQLSGTPNLVGTPEIDIQSLPFDDGLFPYPDQYATSTANDSTPLYFTGKERELKMLQYKAFFGVLGILAERAFLGPYLFNKLHPAPAANTSPAPAESTPADPNQKPEFKPNEGKHHQNAKGRASREPANSRDLYNKAVKSNDKPGTWWAKDSEGVLHRFSSDNAGGAHWSSSTAGENAIESQHIPRDIK